eukprot:TRINITY_DN1855_c0_g2_i1.p1 TRINITY_DN1855_c0_g2~~TRINITY_DN1855_c0_g2_i1.p1  ORF type:complete len:512 (-),score=82.58 TRINITY_DN1855_c0_g2_i1:377-1912(-)
MSAPSTRHLLLTAIAGYSLPAAAVDRPTCGSILERKPHLTCGVCMDVAAGQDCEKYDVCGCMNREILEAAGGCARLGFCDEVKEDADDFWASSGDDFDLRVTKGHGSRDYPYVRISTITQTADDPSESGFFDFSAQFKYAWTGNYLHTALKTVTPGKRTEFRIGKRTVSVTIPARGDGVAGVLIADPCVRFASILSLIACDSAEKHQTAERIPALLNAFVGSEETNFWGILGDNWYDRTGHTTRGVFSKLSQAVKETPFVTVAGNHDYWVLGDPSRGSGLDQCGNGHMQYYAQDSDAASLVAPGAKLAPFNYSVKPPLNPFTCHPAAADNSRYFHQIGNVGIIAQSGVFTEEEYLPFMKRACSWLSSTPDIEVGMIVGHWDVQENGAQKDMDVPSFFDIMKTLDGCDAFNAAGNLKFVMGHTHCNVPHPHGHNDTGFMVAGQGMEGCGNFGVPVVDTTEGRTRVLFFNTTTDEQYTAVLSCVQGKGWRACAESFATTWLDQKRAVSPGLII